MMTASGPTGVLYLGGDILVGMESRPLTDIVGGLDRSRFQPAVVSAERNPLTSWAEARRIPCWSLGASDWQSRRAFLWQALRLASIIRSTRSSIVHAMSPTLYRPLGLAGFIAGAARVCHLGAQPTRGELIWSFRFAPDVVIGCHEQQARDVQTLLASVKPRTRVIGISNGVDLNVFTPRDTATAAASGEWRFGADHVVVSVANLTEVKGHVDLLHAAARVVAELPRCAFLFLGEGLPNDGYQARLRRLAGELGLTNQVHFLGWRPDVANVLRSADLMVLASASEGLPLAVLEAMACALPVVATSVGGIPEAVLQDETGLLVPPRDPGALAASMLRLLNAPGIAHQMGQRGRKRAEASFSLDRVHSRINQLYGELVPKRANSR